MVPIIHLHLPLLTPTPTPLRPPRYGPGVTLHGFDSFIGIPEKWNNLEGGTFTMEGKVPELVTNMKNIQVHKGWFNETKYDLDHLDRVAFLHMDMDIYPAAREVSILLNTSFCCSFVERILLFDVFSSPRRRAGPQALLLFACTMVLVVGACFSPNAM